MAPGGVQGAVGPVAGAGAAEAGGTPSHRALKAS